MSKWEYHVVTFEAGEDRFNAVTMQTILNQLGAEAWKIVSITPLLSASTRTAADTSERSLPGATLTRAVMVTLRRRLRKSAAGERG